MSHIVTLSGVPAAPDCVRKRENERRRQTDIERGKERGIEGPSELQIEQGRERDERAKSARDIESRANERAREREVEREKIVARAMTWRFSPLCLD